MQLADLIAQGEHQQQDFKYEISNISKIAHSLSAFANTDGGRLLIGVKDNGRIAGVRGEEEMYMVQAAGELWCDPPVPCHMQSLRVEGRTVVIATIEPAAVRPVRAKMEDGRYCAFVRIADENIVASPVQMELWRREQQGTSAVFTFTDEQHQLLTAIAAHADGVTLGSFVRLSHLPRRKAVALLADLITFGLVEERFVDHRFRYVPAKG